MTMHIKDFVPIIRHFFSDLHLQEIHMSSRDIATFDNNSFNTYKPM